MKALSGTFAFVALAVIAIVTLPSCCRKGVSEEVLADEKFCLDQTFCLKFGTKKDNQIVYVKVKQPDFDQAVKTLADPGPGHGGKHKIRYIDNNDVPDDPYDPDHPHDLSIKTDKVITSGLAQNAPAGETTANANATYRVKSNNLADIQRVLDAFPTPTPTPTPTNN